MKENFSKPKDDTFFPISKDPISLSHRTVFAPFIVAIFRIVSEDKAVGSVTPLTWAVLPLLISEAKYISSTVKKNNIDQ